VRGVGFRAKEWSVVKIKCKACKLVDNLSQKAKIK